MILHCKGGEIITILCIYWLATIIKTRDICVESTKIFFFFFFLKVHRFVAVNFSTNKITCSVFLKGNLVFLFNIGGIEVLNKIKQIKGKRELQKMKCLQYFRVYDIELGKKMGENNSFHEIPARARLQTTLLDLSLFLF